MTVWNAGMLISGRDVRCDMVFEQLWEVTERLLSVFQLKITRTTTRLVCDSVGGKHLMRVLPAADVLERRWS